MSSLIDLRQLQNFVALSQERSYTKAARRVHLSQSAISHSVRNLERDLGCQLVKKAGHTLILTEQGELFSREASEIIHRVMDLRNKIDDLGKWGRGRIRIGAGRTACQYFLPPVLRELQATFPECDVIVTPGDSPENLDALRHGTIDVSLSVKHRDMADFTFQHLFSDEMRLVFSRMHAWARRQEIRPEDLAHETILHYSRGSATYDLISRWMVTHRVHVGRTMEFGSMEALKEMARIGQGIAILPDWGIIEGKDIGLISRPIPDMPIRREWGVASLKGKTPSLLEETFAGLCEQHAKSFVGGNRVQFGVA